MSGTDSGPDLVAGRREGTMKVDMSGVRILIHYGGRLRPKETTVELSRVPVAGERIRMRIYRQEEPNGPEVQVDVRMAVVEVEHHPPGNQALLYCTVIHEEPR